jgi:hypothetical protein
MIESAPTPGSEEYEQVIELLVGLALDDLEGGNLDAAAALRLVASRAWVEGYREGANLGACITDQREVQDGAAGPGQQRDA